jgi:hypothetical protein
LQDLPKFNQRRIFGLKINHLATLIQSACQQPPFSTKPNLKKAIIMKKRVFSFFIFYTAELSNEMTGKGLDKT